MNIVKSILRILRKKNLRLFFALVKKIRLYDITRDLL